MNEPLASMLESAAQAWWGWMWSMTWQVSGLVLFLTALTWLLRHRSARLRYAIWLLVPIRLILPPTLALATGWGWWVLPSGDLVDATSPMAAISTLTPVAPRASQGSVQASTSVPARAPANGPETLVTPTVLTWRAVFFVAWLVGVLVLLVRLTHGAFRAARIARCSLSASDEVLHLADRCRRRVGLQSRVDVRVADCTSVPLVMGIVRPTIVLPAGLAERLTARELEAVIVHELVHVARRDALVNVLQALLGILYFPQPLVWIANRYLCQLREDACDETTVAVLEGQRRDYGSGIVKVVEMMTSRPPRMALGIAESDSQVKRRLRRILDPRLPSGRQLSWSACAALWVLAAVVLPAAARPIPSAQTEVPWDARLLARLEVPNPYAAPLPQVSIGGMRRQFAPQGFEIKEFGAGSRVSWTLTRKVPGGAILSIGLDGIAPDYIEDVSASCLSFGKQFDNAESLEFFSQVLREAYRGSQIEEMETWLRDSFDGQSSKYCDGLEFWVEFAPNYRHLRIRPDPSARQNAKLDAPGLAGSRAPGAAAAGFEMLFEHWFRLDEQLQKALTEARGSVSPQESAEINTSVAELEKQIGALRKNLNSAAQVRWMWNPGSSPQAVRWLTGHLQFLVSQGKNEEVLPIVKGLLNQREYLLVEQQQDILDVAVVACVRMDRFHTASTYLKLLEELGPLSERQADMARIITANVRSSEGSG